jgi:hypothetical protein
MYTLDESSSAIDSAASPLLAEPLYLLVHKVSPFGLNLTVA